jgi:hypothetical protein
LPCETRITVLRLTTGAAVSGGSLRCLLRLGTWEMMAYPLA